MIHDPALLERLSAFDTEPFAGEVFRATRVSLDPLAASTSGGRWAPKGLIAVLYTSLERDGALAEISFHWGKLTPPPSKHAHVHRLGVAVDRRLRLLKADLHELGVAVASYEALNYQRTQEIGGAVGFLGYDGLMVPSARWECENLVLMMDNHALTNRLETVATEEVDWTAWARSNGFIDASGA